MARSVKMTSMPQMVALLNGFGGGASLVVGGAEFLKSELRGELLPGIPRSPFSSRC
jgi:NAD/NADP transhydrogenase beta subunit